MATCLASLPSDRADINLPVTTSTSSIGRRRSGRSTPFSSKTKPPKLSISTSNQRRSPSPSHPSSANHDKLHSAVEPHNHHPNYHLSYGHKRAASNGNAGTVNAPSPRQIQQIQQQYDAGNICIEAIYHDGPKSILPNLYLGSEMNAKDVSRMMQLGIGYVLNVAKEVVLGGEEPLRQNNLNKTQEELQELFRSLLTPCRQNPRTQQPPIPVPPPHQNTLYEESSGSSDNGSNGSLSPETNWPNHHHLMDVPQPQRNKVHHNASIRMHNNSRHPYQSHQRCVSDSFILTSSGSVSNNSSCLTSPPTPTMTTVSPLSSNFGATKSSYLPFIHHSTSHSHSHYQSTHSIRSGNTTSTTTTNMHMQAPPPVIYKNLPWSHEEFIIASLPTAFAFIDEARKNNRAVLVNCQQGVSRSASLVIAYVMKALGMSAWQAYAYVKERASYISPNISLMAQLVEFEKWCLGPDTIAAPSSQIGEGEVSQ